jgi:hypothetical protein
MSSSNPPGTVYLRPGQFLRCAERRAVWLSVVRGRVWVTRAHDLDDHFLDAGQSIRLDAGCQALVGAEGAAQLTLLEERPRAGRGAATTIGASPRPSPQPS